MRKAKAHITTDVLVFIVKTCKAQRISFHLNNIQSAYNVYEKTMCKMKNQTKKSFRSAYALDHELTVPLVSFDDESNRCSKVNQKSSRKDKWYELKKKKKRKNKKKIKGNLAMILSK